MEHGEHRKATAGHRSDLIRSDTVTTYTNFLSSVSSHTHGFRLVLVF